jgi:formamidopyrimidine-DNA glycosylase
MPELPEVETVVRGLQATVIGLNIQGLTLSDKKLRLPYPQDLKQHLLQQRIYSVTRRSKYILINLSNHYTICVHLGMSGKLIVGKPERLMKHDHVTLSLSGGIEMKYNDPRRFGLFTTIRSQDLDYHQLFANLGIEPLTDEFNGRYLLTICSGKSTPIKPFLMDATKIVGVGNIYAAESLFKARISPQRSAGSLSLKEAELLVNAIKEVLLSAIESGGSTLRDYANSSGQAGYFQHNFKVYGRADQPCLVCGNTLQSIKQMGRSTFFCSTCQK